LQTLHNTQKVEAAAAAVLQRVADTSHVDVASKARSAVDIANENVIPASCCCYMLNVPSFASQKGLNVTQSSQFPHQADFDRHMMYFPQ
jgi:hypothetical protein